MFTCIILPKVELNVQYRTEKAACSIKFRAWLKPNQAGEQIAPSSIALRFIRFHIGDFDPLHENLGSLHRVY